MITRPTPVPSAAAAARLAALKTRMFVNYLVRSSCPRDPFAASTLTAGQIQSKDRINIRSLLDELPLWYTKPVDWLVFTPL
jgi:hypothetical protein